MKNVGFTLIEVLVVVLIIAVLSAVALPQYQKAVLKSRFAALMPIGKTLANSNEAYYLQHGFYADTPQDLPVEGQSNYPNGTAVDLTDDDNYSYVFVGQGTNSPNNYLVYQNHSAKFASNVHCEADEENTLAQEVCQNLGGQEINGSQSEGYKTYVLSGMVGENDKLPSSLTKLAKQLCEGKTNCTATVGTNTVTTQECTGDADTTAGQTCINRTYNDTGTQIDYEKTQTRCRSFNSYYAYRGIKCDSSVADEQNVVSKTTSTVCNEVTATWENGVCTPKATASGMPYYEQTITEGNKKTIEAFHCPDYQDNVCRINQKVVHEYLNNKPVSTNNVQCLGVIHADNTCNDEEWKRNTLYNYNTQGNQTRDFDCFSFAADNTCTSFAASSYWKTYANDGETETSKTTVDTDYSNNVTFTTTNSQTNEVTSMVKCNISNADWDTGTCKPGTAI